jgi:hypothetical protein
LDPVEEEVLTTTEQAAVAPAEELLLKRSLGMGHIQ